jgi:hypothetical protein
MSDESDQLAIREKYHDSVDKFFVKPVLTGWLQLDQILGPRIYAIKRLKDKEKLARDRVVALRELGHGKSSQSLKARVFAAPMVVLADKSAQAYTDVLSNLKEQVIQGGNLWLQRDRRNIIGLSTTDENKLLVLNIAATIAAGPGLKALSVAGTGFKVWLLNAGFSFGAYEAIDKMFGFVSVGIASLFDTTSGAIADWWLPPVTEKQADKWTEDFNKLYAVKVSELQSSPDPGLRALVPKLESAYKGRETGPMTWIKTNWKWLVAGSLITVIVLNPVKNRG